MDTAATVDWKHINTMSARVIKTISRSWRDERGVALIEFLIIFPVVALLLFGAIEMARYVLITQKIERAGFVLGDMVSQYRQEELTLDALSTVFAQYNTIMSPYGAAGKQSVVLSSVTKDPGDKRIKIRWQYSGGGSLTNDKTVSIVSGLNVAGVSAVAVGDESKFSGDVAAQLSTMLDNENMIVAEVFFEYQPILSGVLSASASNAFNIGPRTLIRRTYFRPRKGDLNCPAGYTQSSSSGGVIVCTIPGGTSSTSSGSSSSGGGGGGGCFAKGTKILLAGGRVKSVEALSLGDRVQGLNGINRVTRITAYHSDEPLYSINGSRAFVTGEHPFFGTSGELYAIDPSLTYDETHEGIFPNRLTRGTGIITLDGARKIDRIETVTPAAKQPLYNVTVDGDNTYFADEHLMHNVGSDAAGVTANTQIRLVDGSSKPIRSVREGDVLQGESSRNTVRTVLTLRTHHTLYSINGSDIRISGGHLIMTTEGWRTIEKAPAYLPEAQDIPLLAVGDTLVTDDGTRVIVERITPHRGTHTLYHLALDGDHTYYAGGVLVHNFGAAGDGEPKGTCVPMCKV